MTMTFTPGFSTPDSVAYRVRLAKDDAPTYAPFTQVSSSWLTEPRSTTGPAFAASSGVSVTVVRIHIWPMKPSGLVPVHSAQAPSAGGAVFHDVSSCSGIQGRPSFGRAAVHQDSHRLPHWRMADAWSLR